MKRLVAYALFAALFTPAVFAAEAEWTTMFDGKSLDGWKAAENPAGFKVENGEIVVNGTRGHLFFLGADGKASFKDFEFQAEVMTTAGSNSGIFIHTTWQDKGWPSHGYEMQVNATHSDKIKTGSIYNVVMVNPAPHKDDEWFTYTITVKGGRITAKVNDQVVTDYEEKAEDIKGDRKLSAGTIALQAHDPKSLVRYRNLKIRAL